MDLQIQLPLAKLVSRCALLETHHLIDRFLLLVFACIYEHLFQGFLILWLFFLFWQKTSLEFIRLKVAHLHWLFTVVQREIVVELLNPFAIFDLELSSAIRYNCLLQMLILLYLLLVVRRLLRPVLTLVFFGGPSRLCPIEILIVDLVHDCVHPEQVVTSILG